MLPDFIHICPLNVKHKSSNFKSSMPSKRWELCDLCVWIRASNFFGPRPVWRPSAWFGLISFYFPKLSENLPPSGVQKLCPQIYAYCTHQIMPQFLFGLFQSPFGLLWRPSACRPVLGVISACLDALWIVKWFIFWWFFPALDNGPLSLHLLVDSLYVCLETLGHGGVLHDLSDVVVGNGFPTIDPFRKRKIEFRKSIFCNII